MTVGVRGMLIRLLSQREAAVLTLAGFFDLHYYPFACTTKRRPRLDRIIFDKHFRDGLGCKPLGAITSADLQAWVAEHAARGYKPGTVNKHIFLLNRLLRLAREWGMLEGAGGGGVGGGGAGSGGCRRANGGSGSRRRPNSRRCSGPARPRTTHSSAFSCAS
ncbi:MAG: hypothetical protein ACO3WM_04905 [Gemmobacter sp.]